MASLLGVLHGICRLPTLPLVLEGTDTAPLRRVSSRMRHAPHHDRRAASGDSVEDEAAVVGAPRTGGAEDTSITMSDSATWGYRRRDTGRHLMERHREHRSAWKSHGLAWSEDGLAWEKLVDMDKMLVLKSNAEQPERRPHNGAFGYVRCYLTV